MRLKNVKKICEQNHRTVRSLAVDIGMSEGNLHRSLREDKIWADALEKIAITLGCPITEFFDKKVSPEIIVTADNNSQAAGHDITINGEAMIVAQLKSQIKEKDKIIKLLTSQLEILQKMSMQNIDDK